MFEAPRFPSIDFPQIEVVELTVAEIKAMSDAELLSVLSGESEHEGIVPQPLQQLITAELLARTLAKNAKPHWSVVPSFWLLVAATLLAFVAAVAAILALPSTSAAVRSPAQQSAPASLPPESTKPAPSGQNAP